MAGSNPPSPPSSVTHPALTVPNITNFIKVKLDIEKSQYNTWSELFKIHARAYQVIDHIIPSSADDTRDISLKQTDPKLWSRLDAVVLQWIYGTISDDLLNTIIERDTTAEMAWNRLFEIFFDNKHSRALYLEQEFSRVQMEQFPNASSYCQHLKTLSDQLSNVGAPVSNERLVLQLISGLTDAYAAVGSQIRHGETLPPFYKARSMIVLEETAKAQKAATVTDNSAFLASQDVSTVNNSSQQNYNNTPNSTNQVVAATIQPLTAVVVATVVAVVIVVGVATEVAIIGHNITNIRNNNSGLFHLGLHRGNHGPRHHVRTQLRQIGNISPLLASKEFLDQSLHKLIWQPHQQIMLNHHMHQPTFKLRCILFLWLLLMISGTWIPGPPLT